MSGPPASSDSGAESDKIALGIGIGVGLPAAVAGMIGAYYAVKLYYKRRI